MVSVFQITVRHVTIFGIVMSMSLSFATLGKLSTSHINTTVTATIKSFGNNETFGFFTYVFDISKVLLDACKFAIVRIATGAVALPQEPINY
ncbi:hypothetical protein DdX_08187 [Ditylenchus destructor]|uniref:Uncharacterized protein n=1 Tax=Ditylenchus destructor TaxID=166010 RepID=A0AAD4N6W8_9BILA|nr:hypothetical protein DdX_08187 [Ditylenchus destructor]